MKQSSEHWAEDASNVDEIASSFLASMMLINNNFFHRTTLPMPLSQFCVLAYLEVEHAVSITDLSRVLKVSKQQMSTVVDKLLQAGYVTKSRSERDHRCTLVQITDSGLDLLLEHRGQLTRMLSDQFKKLTPDELNRFGRIIIDGTQYLRKIYEK